MDHKNQKLNYQQICISAKTLTKRVAEFIKQEAGRVSEHQIQDKDHNSLVSYVDETAERMLVEGLSQIMPAATFITEEKTVENTKSALQWIIDPLDGTTNFLHGIPIYSVSVALVVKDEPVVGIVHEINQDESFYAYKGGGAFLNDGRIHVKHTPELANALIATGFPGRSFEHLSAYEKAMNVLMQSTRGIRRLGSAAVDLAYVACGRYDGYFEYGLNAWDIAGGILLVKEAGGTITNFSGGDDALYNGEMLATNGHIHKSFLDILREHYR